MLTALLLVTCLLSLAQLRHVADQANTFTDAQEQALEQRMQKLYDTYGFDTVIVTTNDSRGQTAQMYAADFYDEFRSYSDYPNGLIFSFNFDLGEYYEATRGIGQTIFTSGGEDELYNVLSPYLGSRSYYDAMNAYLTYVENKISRYAVAGADGKMTLSTTKRLPSVSEAISQAADYLLFYAGGGLLAGLGVAFGLKSKLQVAKPQPDANRYTVPGSLNLRDSSDIFLYQTVTRTRIQENRSGGGGGRGGGGSFRSSGGGSYGGRGGKL